MAFHYGYFITLVFLGTRVGQWFKRPLDEWLMGNGSPQLAAGFYNIFSFSVDIIVTKCVDCFVRLYIIHIHTFSIKKYLGSIKNI